MNKQADYNSTNYFDYSNIEPVSISSSPGRRTLFNSTLSVETFAARAESSNLTA